ncbi:hypothetical protein SAMN05421820_10464 [Pedobacter steynii]|uniref:Uncharacterized protein n=1 Tax=Pedobacter steynii TaxID=430522 RepID=A0A1G9U505_9SPHI|nr:hypothetical protein [Pedobacter steynii]NQX40660.1 hypothetical protein [Pedobacter steynii]SDM55057.1 hypothetical protein SAMN05421820_10464 [Pedobacter steynii]
MTRNSIKAKAIIILVLAFAFTGCAPGIRNYVNKKYPPVSSLAKSTAAVKQSIEGLQKLSQVDLGAKISSGMMDSTFHQYFDSLIKKNDTLGLAEVEKIEVVKKPVFSLGNQELIIGTSLKFFLKKNKYLKDIQISFTGRLAPSIAGDTLVLRPGFQRIKIEALHLSKCLFLGKAAKLAVNSLCLAFMDNINGQIKDINIKISYPPLPEEKISKLIGTNANIIIRNDFTFKLKSKILTPVILINPQNLLVLSAIADGKEDSGSIAIAAQTDTIKANPAIDHLQKPAFFVNEKQQLISVNNVVLANMTSASTDKTAENLPQNEFNEQYAYLDSAFRESWKIGLDTIDYRDSTSSAVHLSYGAISRITNELFRDVKFDLAYKIDISTPFKETNIKLDEIQKPDCGAIHFDCNLNNCSNGLSNCDYDCKWWQGWCYARQAACKSWNAVKWSACQAANALKLTQCAAELVTRKAFCYTTVAAIFLYDNMIKPVGKFNGYAKASGTISGGIDQTLPDGINSISFNGSIDADINAEVGLGFVPSGLLGLMVCSLPTAAKFNLNHITLADKKLQLRADFLRLTNNEHPFLKISMSKLTLPVKLKEPFLIEILKNPKLILNCGSGILAGLSYLALAKSETFNKFLDLSLKGSYNFDIQHDFDIQLPAIPLEVLQYKTILNPAWGSKSLVYNNLIQKP